MTDTRKLAEEILQKHICISNGFIPIFDERIFPAMEEYAQQHLKSLAPTDEEIKEAANESYYSADKYRGFLDGAEWMREKLTGKSEEKQKGAPFDEAKTTNPEPVKTETDKLFWEIVKLGVERQTTYELQYMDYPKNIWTTPIKLTIERAEAFYPDYSLKTIKFHFAECDIIMNL